MASPVLPITEGVAELALVQTRFATGNVHLYTATAHPPGSGSVLADFTEAIYTGYALVETVTWSAPFLDSNGNPAISSGMQTFVGPSSGAGQTILGAYFTDGANAVLHLVLPFDTPVPMSAPLDQLGLNIQYAVAGGGTISLTGTLEP